MTWFVERDRGLTPRDLYPYHGDANVDLEAQIHHVTDAFAAESRWPSTRRPLYQL
jgi:hypothetical protein